MDKLLHIKLDLIAEKLNAYKVERIMSVVYRTYTRSDGVQVYLVDFYPHWNATGTFGRMKVASEYLDHDWQKERFEKFSGLRLGDLPLLDRDQALRRVYGQQHPNEVQVKRPFELLLQPQPGAEGENDGKTLIRRYIPVNGRAAATAPPPPPPAAAPPAAPEREAMPPKDWELAAMTAVDAFDFDESLHKSDPAAWESAGKVTNFRQKIFGDWDPEKTPGYVAGLARYATGRVEKGEGHEAAKEAALAACAAALGEGT